MEGEIDDFISAIFSNAPEAPGKYAFAIDWASTDAASPTERTTFLFKQLLYIFTEGAKRLFGTTTDAGAIRVDLDNMSPHDLYLMGQYFASFGIKINCDIEEIAEAVAATEPTNNTDKLKDYFLTLETTAKVYTISFDYLI